jgi:cysteinyl-tRNA synthetase
MFRLYDTRTRQAEEIRPGRGLLRMYTCGPTVYRSSHVGNLRSYLFADLIRRNAEHRHHLTVLTCQNITDVGHLTDDATADPDGEDKILAQARAEGRTPLELARSYENEFLADCSALNLRPAEHMPRA